MSCQSCPTSASTTPVAGCSSSPTTMGGKPVYEIDIKTVVDFNSKFGHKKMCDHLTFTLGMICVYSCTFCYVIPMILKLAAIQAVKRSAALLGRGLEEVIIRKRRALRVLRRQLTIDKPWWVNLQKKKVIYTSPLVDAAANMVLVKETAVACKLIFELTNWDVRVLSKSSLLPELAKRIPEKYKHRVVYGVSTGTFGDELCAAFEKGTHPVSKRIKSLHWLQDHGYRTFAMLCPILPQVDYDAYVAHALEQVRVDRCEHVWAEVINLRGPSFDRTCDALRQGVFPEHAERLEQVCGEGSESNWESYARNTFEAVARLVGPEKLRFLQYASPKTADYWVPQETRGAVLLSEAFES